MSSMHIHDLLSAAHPLFIVPRCCHLYLKKNKIVKNSSKNSNFDDSGIPLPGSLLELIQNCICNPLDGWKVHNEP